MPDLPRNSLLQSLRNKNHCQFSTLFQAKEHDDLHEERSDQYEPPSQSSQNINEESEDSEEDSSYLPPASPLAPP